jgi:hypothetical protein
MLWHQMARLLLLQLDNAAQVVNDFRSLPSPIINLELILILIVINGMLFLNQSRWAHNYKRACSSYQMINVKVFHLQMLNFLLFLESLFSFIKIKLGILY